MARIVVTGATGFIGTRLVRVLRESGHDVTVMLHLNEPDKDCFAGLPHLRADVTQPHTLLGKFDGFDTVFHLAGCTIARKSDDFYRVNRDGTRNVAESCAASDSPPQLVFVSSLAAAAQLVTGSQTENRRLLLRFPITARASSKPKRS